MSSTLSEGVRVPDIGSTSWGADVNFNWGLLNTALANISGNVKTDVANTWTAPQTFSETISGSIDGVAARAVGDEDGTNIKTALASKAADNAVVHLAGAETISGNKTWTGYNTFKVTINMRDVAAVSAGGYGEGLGFYDYEGNRYGYIQPHVTSDGTKNIVFGNSASGYLEFASSLVPYANNVIGLGSSSNAWSAVYADTVYANTSFGVRYASKTASGQPAISGYIQRAFGVKSSDDKYFSRFNSQIAATYSRTEFETNLYDSNSDVLASVKIQHVAQYNSSTGTTSLYVRPTVSGVVDLGLVSNKWKSLNGINPGALSFPDNSAYIDISSSITDRTYGANSFVAAATGWISIGSFATAIQIADDTTGMAITGLPGSDGYSSVFLPVRAGDSIRVLINQTSTTFQSFRLLPCLGNV